MSHLIDYNLYMRRAMQHMIGEILARVAEEGLPGDHHFYISFKTQMQGVVIPMHLAQAYPEEMTIVLQDWFDDLGVLEDRFAVTLSFHGKAEQLVIPFDALTGFSDPSVQFNLRFEEAQPENQTSSDQGEVEIDEGSAQIDAEIIQLDSFRKP